MLKTNPLHVVHVSSAHPWTDNRIHYRECVTLAEAGYSVTLVAAESSVAGPLTAVKIVPVAQRNRLPRILFSTSTVIRLALKTKARIIHLHDPELIPFIPFLRIAGRVVIYDAHEDLPVQVINKPYVLRPLIPLIKLLAYGLIAVSKLSDHCVCATETIAKRYAAEKSTVVHNYPTLRAEEATAESASSADRSSAAVYVGGIASSRGAQVMVDAMVDPGLPDDWILTLAGSGSESVLTELRRRPGWDRVDFHGQLPPDEARQLIIESRVGLVLFGDSKAHRDALPTKMFEYFAAGTPVIASDFPLWRSIIEGNDCGVLVDPGSSAQVAAAIRQYAENPELLNRHSRNARELARVKLNWSGEASALLSLYQQISSHSPGSVET